MNKNTLFEKRTWSYYMIRLSLYAIPCSLLVLGSSLHAESATAQRTLSALGGIVIDKAKDCVSFYNPYAAKPAAGQKSTLRTLLPKTSAVLENGIKGLSKDFLGKNLEAAFKQSAGIANSRYETWSNVGSTSFSAFSTLAGINQHRSKLTVSAGGIASFVAGAVVSWSQKYGEDYASGHAKTLIKNRVPASHSLLAQIITVLAKKVVISPLLSDVAGHIAATPFFAHNDRKDWFKLGASLAEPAYRIHGIASDRPADVIACVDAAKHAAHTGGVHATSWVRSHMPSRDTWIGLGVIGSFLGLSATV